MIKQYNHIEAQKDGPQVPDMYDVMSDASGLEATPDEVTMNRRAVSPSAAFLLRLEMEYAR